MNLPKKTILANELRQLVAKGSSVSVEYSGEAAIDRWTDILIRVKPADYLVKGEAGRTALHVFAEAVAIEYVPQELLNATNLAIRDCHGNTVIHEVAKRGQLAEIPSQLLTPEVLTEKDLFGTTPMQYALGGGHVDTVPQRLITSKNLDLEHMHKSLIQEALNQHAFKSIRNLTPEGMAMLNAKERKDWLLAIKKCHLERELSLIVEDLQRDWSHIESPDAWRSL